MESTISDDDEDNEGRSRMRAALTCIVLAALTTLATAQEAIQTPQAALAPLTLDKVFTFLFLTLGPFNVIGPFAEITRGRDPAFKRRLAFEATLIAAIGLFVAATLGQSTLTRWGVSAAALFIATGVLLFLAGLQFVLAEYKPLTPETGVPEGVKAASAPLGSLAFSPLAFPIIVTPYGIAVLVVSLTLASDETARDGQILAIAALVLLMDLLVMLMPDRALKSRFVDTAFGIVGCVTAVLQIALSVEAVIVGLRLLGILRPGAA